MKVFLTTTPRFKVHYEKNIEAIFNAIKKLGHIHVNEYIVKVGVEEFYKFDKDKRPLYYKEILESLRKADVVIFETSLHSIGVGHLLEKSLELGKGVIALHMKGKFPFFLSGIKEQRLVIEEYTLGTLSEVLKCAFEDVIEQMDVRFNFFISPKIGAFLDWIAKKKKVPRAVYLRRLIEQDMKKNKEYKA